MNNLPVSNGFTQKEINERIDLLHEKVNSKISRQELFGWIVAVGALAALVGNLM